MTRNAGLSPTGHQLAGEPEGAGDGMRHESMTRQHPRPAGTAADAVVGGVKVNVGAAVRHEVRGVPGGSQQLR